jgi:hypothetical protein
MSKEKIEELEFLNYEDVKTKLKRIPVKARKKPIIITAYQIKSGNFKVHSLEFLNYEDVKTKLKNPVKARKKPITITAYQIKSGDFKVHSKEGIHQGRKDDWLMVGVDNEIYVCDKKIFEKTYDILTNKNDNSKK